MTGPTVAVDDAATTDEDSAVTIDVLANDTDVEGDVLTVSAAAIGGGAGGSVSIVDGELVFTPDASFDALNVGESSQVDDRPTPTTDEIGCCSWRLRRRRR